MSNERESIPSALSQLLTRHGVTVSVAIVGDGEGKWILEVIDADRNSHEWEHHFDTDQEALDEAIRALEEDPLEFAPHETGTPH